MAVLLTSPHTVAPLFAGWNDTMIISCLEGIMGKVYGNGRESPTSSLTILKDFAFLAGQPDRELIALAMENTDFRILVPQNQAWSQAIEAVYGTCAKAVTRYATRKDNIFEYSALQTLLHTIPHGLSLHPVNEMLYQKCLLSSWSRDLVSSFPCWKEYAQWGLGVVLCDNKGAILSGASSYNRYSHGIEIEIDTHPDFRRRGYALLCGAALILLCRKQGLYPSWDAQNPGSLSLAQKLGYTFSHTYTAYEVRGQS